MRASPHWLDVVRSRIRNTRAPLLLVLQHHIIDARTVVAAPLRPASEVSSLLNPTLRIGGVAYGVALLDMAAVPLLSLGEVVGSALDQADSVTDGLDAIFRGHPVGLPVF
jgi:hypothetical protein